VTRQRDGDGPGQRDADGDDWTSWRFLTGLSVWPCARSARIPQSLPSRPGGAVSPYGRMGHGVQRRQRGDGQAAGPAAARWPAAATSAAGQIEKPTYSASLLFPHLAASPAARRLIGGLHHRLVYVHQWRRGDFAHESAAVRPRPMTCARGAHTELRRSCPDRAVRAAVPAPAMIPPRRTLDVPSLSATSGAAYASKGAPARIRACRSSSSERRCVTWPWAREDGLA
jgi:hypothetical protein